MSKDIIKVNMNVCDIPTVVEQIKKLEQENKQLKEKLDYDLKWALKYDELYKENKQLKEDYAILKQLQTITNDILNDLEEWLKERQDYAYEYENVLDKIQELKEKYK